MLTDALISISSYGERPNEFEPVMQYFRARFLNVYIKNNKYARRDGLYIHLTNTVNSTPTVQLVVEDGKHLEAVRCCV